MGESVRTFVVPRQRVGSTRRAVLHAGWAVPAVLAVSAAPAIATSGQPPITISSFGGSCKYPGQSVPGKEFGYHMVVTFETLYAGSVKIDAFTIDGAPTTDITPKVFGLGAGTTTVTFDVFSTNSAQRSASITYTFIGNGTSEQFTTSVPFDSFPPCK